MTISSSGPTSALTDFKKIDGSVRSGWRPRPPPAWPPSPGGGARVGGAAAPPPSPTPPARIDQVAARFVSEGRSVDRLEGIHRRVPDLDQTPHVRRNVGQVVDLRGSSGLQGQNRIVDIDDVLLTIT